MSATRKTMIKISNGSEIKWILKSQDIPDGWRIGVIPSMETKNKISEKHKQPIYAKHIKYDSLEETCFTLKICYGSLIKYASGCIVNKAMIAKSPYFSINDLGKNTNELGWRFP